MHCKSFRFTMSSSFAALAAILWAFRFFCAREKRERASLHGENLNGFCGLVLKLVDSLHSPENFSFLS